MKLGNKEYLNARLSAMLKSVEEKQNLEANLSEENKQKLLSLKNKHKGKRCFIVGSSPSVKDLDLAKLNNEIVFTVNRGYKLSESGLNKSTYHVMSDNYTLKDEGVRSEIPQNFTEQFLIYGGINFPFKENVTYFDYVLNPNKLKEDVKDCISKPFLSCSTIIAYVLQFAYFMGFEGKPSTLPKP